MTGSFESLGDDDWDTELADDLIGGTLLVGLTYLDADGAILERREIFGRVLSCAPETGIAIQETSGEPVVIAPVMEAIDAAEPGVYELADGRVVEDPDFVALISVTRPSRS